MELARAIGDAFAAVRMSSYVVTGQDAERLLYSTLSMQAINDGLQGRSHTG